MEILKEVRISTANAECLSVTDSRYHINLYGLLDNLHERDSYVTVKDVVVPPIRKFIKFDSSYHPQNIVMLLLLSSQSFHTVNHHLYYCRGVPLLISRSARQGNP